LGHMPAGKRSMTKARQSLYNSKFEWNPAGDKVQAEPGGDKVMWAPPTLPLKYRLIK
jgi:hypothetical protein